MHCYRTRINLSWMLAIEALESRLCLICPHIMAGFTFRATKWRPHFRGNAEKERC